MVVAIVLAALIVWVSVLTASVVRRKEARGEPVYRPLPDGRLRFEWGVSTAYQRAVREAQTGPITRSSPSAPRGRA